MNSSRAMASSPTLEMVAERAGVSRATVSRVVNGSPSVSPEVARAVRDAISDMGYVPNRAARSLASRQAHAIALVVPEDMTRFFGDVFFSTVIVGINNRLSGTDYVLNLLVASDDPGAKAMRYLAAGSVDGALVLSHHASDTFLDTLSTFMPVVFGGRPAEGIAGGFVVDIDNVAGAATATKHLIERGRRTIATISGPPSMASGSDRLEGWRSALVNAGLEPGPIADGDFTLHGGNRGMRQILAENPNIDGVFVASDLMATGAMQVLRAAGKRVPEDVSVVGFDDSSAALASEVPLTTIHQPLEQMGWTMADVLLATLSGDDARPRTTILPAELVRRRSA